MGAVTVVFELPGPSYQVRGALRVPDARQVKAQSDFSLLNWLANLKTAYPSTLACIEMRVELRDG